MATALIEHQKTIAKLRGAWVICIQAGPDDGAAVQFHSKLGVRKDVLHFDMPVSD